MTIFYGAPFDLGSYMDVLSASDLARYSQPPYLLHTFDWSLDQKRPTHKRTGANHMHHKHSDVTHHG